jgi:succinate dehydrogenase / fumarate reductase cytochrome b subunit
MSKQPDQRPISPYMLGPYYKFQITSLLSITSRLTGVFLTVATAPVAVLWLVALIIGEAHFELMQAFLGSWVGFVFLLGSLFSLCYHLLNGLRHLAWDTGRFLEMEQVRSTGYLVLAGVAALMALTLWAAS